MSDLIERLRHHSKNAVAAKSLEPEYLHEVFGRAADEIARLSALHDQLVRVNGNMKVENDRLTAEKSAIVNAYHEREMRFIAENERLRAAYARYATHDAGCTCEDLMDSGNIFYRHDWECSCGYREALKGDSDE